MLVGSAGIVTAIASLVLSFHGGGTGENLSKGGILVGGLFALWLISRTPPVDRALTRGIGFILRLRGYAERDTGTLLALSGEYSVAELSVRPHDWIAGRTLRELRLRDEGIVVIGIHREGAGYVGAPGADEDRIDELDSRAHGPTGPRGRGARAGLPRAIRG